MSLRIEVERYVLTWTHERVWDVTWNYNGNCISRWLVVALFKAWRRSLRLSGPSSK